MNRLSTICIDQNEVSSRIETRRLLPYWYSFELPHNEDPVIHIFRRLLTFAYASIKYNNVLPIACYGTANNHYGLFSSKEHQQ